MLALTIGPLNVYAVADFDAARMVIHGHLVGLAHRDRHHKTLHVRYLSRPINRLESQRARERDREGDRLSNARARAATAAAATAVATMTVDSYGSVRIQTRAAIGCLVSFSLALALSCSLPLRFLARKRFSACRCCCCRR